MITDVNGVVVQRHDYLPFGQEFSPPATHASERDGGELGRFDLTVSCSARNLNLVSFEHVYHPLPRCLVQRVCCPTPWPSNGQTFPKECDQNFWNPQRSSTRY